MSKQRHVENAVAAFQAYCDRVDPEQLNEVETNMGDLLADLMHLCDEVGIQWREVWLRAEYHYHGDSEEPDFDGADAPCDLDPDAVHFVGCGCIE